MTKGTPGALATIEKLDSAVEEQSIHAGSVFGSLVFYALTGGSYEQWLRTQRNVRLVYLSGLILFVTSKIIASELFRNWAADTLRARHLAHH
jgi:hypothetical protein